jgi:hypothetical protein
MARWFCLASLALGFAAVIACSSSLPAPEMRAHPLATTQFIEVPFPPPAAHPEIVPPKPREGAVWVDGEWTWRGKAWTWESGAWVMAPARAFYSPWVILRVSNGSIRFAPGAWHKEDGQLLPKPTPLALAEPSLEAPAPPNPSQEDAEPGPKGRGE